jgi:hypothetical protein
VKRDPVQLHANSIEQPTAAKIRKLAESASPFRTNTPMAMIAAMIPTREAMRKNHTRAARVSLALNGFKAAP